MRKIGIAVSKGGTGKTTTAVNLAAGLALAGQKVLLVDPDVQGQCSKALGVRPEAGLAEVITEEADLDQALHQARERLWLLAGGRALAGVKRLISRKEILGQKQKIFLTSKCRVSAVRRSFHYRSSKYRSENRFKELLVLMD